MNIDPGKKIRVLIKGDGVWPFVASHEKEMRILTRSDKLESVAEFPANLQLARGILKDCEIGIDLAGVLDLQAERERLQKERNKILSELAQTEKKLSNESFVRNAPANVVEEQKAKFQDLSIRKQKTEEHLRTLGE